MKTAAIKPLLLYTSSRTTAKQKFTYKPFVVTVPALSAKPPHHRFPLADAAKLPPATLLRGGSRSKDSRSPRWGRGRVPAW